MNVKTIIRKNWIFILFTIFTILCVIKKDNYIPVDIVPYPDTYIQFSSDQGTLEQTWLSEVKEISEVSFYCKTENSCENTMKMTVLDGMTKEVIVESVQEVELEKEEQKIIFTFPKTKIIQGNQYIFSLSFFESNKNDVVWIKAGTDYMGCTIDGADQEKGAAFQITFVKNSRIFWLYISLFPLVAFSLLSMVVWSRKWEETVGLSMAILILVLFVAGLFGSLETGIVLVYASAIICFIATVIMFNKKENEVHDLFSPGMIVYGIMVVLILVNNIDSRFARWDEFSHWGLAAKDMFYNNTYAKHFDSAVMMKYYPPVTTLIEYFFCYTNKMYSQSMVYVGFQMLSLCLLSAGLGICKKKKVLPVITLFLGLLFLPITFFYDVYNSIYVDPMLAFGTAYVLICYYSEKINLFNFLRIIGGLFLLTMTKDTGVVIAGVLTLVMLGDVLYKQWKEKKWNIKAVAVPIVCTILVCTIFFTWQIYLSIPIERTEQADVTKIQEEISETETMSVRAIESSGIIHEQEEISETETMSVNGAIGSSGITLDKIIEVMKGDAPTYRYDVIKNYITKLFDENIFSFGVVSFSYMDLAFVILAVTIIIFNVSNKTQSGQNMLSFGVFTFLAGIGYCGFLMVAYMFSFSEVEALKVHSFMRYCGSWICGVFIALYVLLVKISEEYTEKNAKNILSILLTLSLIVVPVEYFYTTNRELQLTDEQVYGFDDVTKILQSGSKKGDKVYFVCNNSDGHAELQFKNAVVPLITEYQIYNIYASKEKYMQQMAIYSQEGIEPRGSVLCISSEEWEERLKGFQYVVLFHPNDVFGESYGSLFEEPETIDDGTVYKVVQTGEHIMLDYIGKTGIKSFR